MVSKNEDLALNPRQQRFATLYTSGLPAGRAYEQAGYASRGNAADVGASKLVRIPKVAEALRRELDAGRQASRLSRDEKLGLLEEIARSTVIPARERIAAIKAHNDMTNDWKTDPWNPCPLDEIRKRAEATASPLCLQLHGSWIGDLAANAANPGTSA